MSLKIPADARCQVSGCSQPVTHLLSLRMRRRDTGADWAPNLPAYFCTEHACSGSDISIRYVPTVGRRNRVRVGVGLNWVERITKIR